MPIDLLILCHPDLKEMRSPDLADGEPSDVCKRNAQRFGVWMARQNLLPDQVMCGPDLISRTVAEKACKAAELNANIVHRPDALVRPRNDSITGFLDRLDPQPDVALVVVNSSVGNRFLDHFKDQQSSGKPLDPGGVSMLHFRVSCHSDPSVHPSGNLIHWIDGTSLPEFFPFPDHRGTELRPRPAYYYCQSAVIPFRHHNGSLEVLVVSTSKRKRWVVPKGIHEPGMTAQNSAANEAMEEAGVLGNVLDLDLGSYDYAKWGATCSVSVYAMQVNQVLCDDDWAESYRLREWLSPSEAAERVYQKELQSMIFSLPQRLAQWDPTENHDR